MYPSKSTLFLAENREQTTAFITNKLRSSYQLQSSMHNIPHLLIVIGRETETTGFSCDIVQATIRSNRAVYIYVYNSNLLLDTRLHIVFKSYRLSSTKNRLGLSRLIHQFVGYLTPRPIFTFYISVLK